MAALAHSKSKFISFIKARPPRSCPLTVYGLTFSAEHLNAAGTSGWGLHTCSGVQWESETTAPARVIALSHTPLLFLMMTSEL